MLRKSLITYLKKLRVITGLLTIGLLTACAVPTTVSTVQNSYIPLELTKPCKVPVLYGSTIKDLIQHDL